jgi:predicted metal-dependent hydrolase
VVRYVVVHDVAHLVQHNRSAKYCAVVATLYPEHLKARRWLREQAGELKW